MQQGMMLLSFSQTFRVSPCDYFIMKSSKSIQIARKWGGYKFIIQHSLWPSLISWAQFQVPLRKNYIFLHQASHLQRMASRFFPQAFNTFTIRIRNMLWPCWAYVSDMAVNVLKGINFQIYQALTLNKGQGNYFGFTKGRENLSIQQLRELQRNWIYFWIPTWRTGLYPMQ